MAFIWIYVGAFGATWGPVSWTPVAEIFPLSVRSKGSSFGASSNWIWFFLPETKGATLEEMDRVFKSRSGETDMILLDEARRDVAIAHDATLEIEKERYLQVDLSLLGLLRNQSIWHDLATLRDSLHVRFLDMWYSSLTEAFLVKFYVNRIRLRLYGPTRNRSTEGHVIQTVFRGAFGGTSM
ncbi:hypothetical protein PENANT_c001G07375 [Penicillium antarcticum]|uniref:Major facilitator superfamily (MFS) profile domain-containing protein n=1 Tax=Penicillium antarcticum TaxID=416450 RepID=A0A1V6QNP6_9EURO|nr:hypothetical protein PENANT_c001G07375 [Penicillium antarcticum]